MYQCMSIKLQEKYTSSPVKGSVAIPRKTKMCLPSRNAIITGRKKEFIQVNFKHCTLPIYSQHKEEELKKY